MGQKRTKGYESCDLYVKEVNVNIGPSFEQTC